MYPFKKHLIKGEKNLKKVRVMIVFLIIIIICLINNSYADSLDNQFYLSEQGIFVNLQQDNNKFYNVLEELNKNDSVLNQNIETKQNLLNQIEQYKLVLWLVDSLNQNNITQQILISCDENQISRQMYDLNTFSNDKLQKYYNQYINSLKSTIDIKSSELIKTDDGEVYLFYDTSSNYNGKEINSYSYYTIMNGKIFTINITFLDSSYGKQEANAIIENIKFDNQNESVFFEEDDYSMLVVLISLLALFVVSMVKKFVKTKNKKELTEEEKNRFKKIGGIYVFYIITVILTLLNNIVGLLQRNLFQSGNVVETLIKIQSIVIIVVNIIILMHIIKNSDVNSIAKLIFNCGIFNLVIYFLIGCSSIVISETLVKSFYLNIIYSIISNTIYIILWGCYFRLSKRIKVLAEK